MQFLRHLLLFIPAVLLSSTVVAAPPDGWSLYDDFSDRTINAEFWDGKQSFNHYWIDPPVGEYQDWSSYELLRMVVPNPIGGEKPRGLSADGTLDLVNRTHGVMSGDGVGATRTRLGLALQDRSEVVGVGGRIGFNDVDVVSCYGRDSARLRIITGFYNINSSSVPGDLTGEVMAWIGLRKRASFTAEGMRVDAVVFECGDPDCQTVEWSDGVVFPFASAKEYVDVTMEWDESSASFIFTYNGAEVSISSVHNERYAPQSSMWVQAAVDLSVCPSEPAQGYIDGKVDEIYIKYSGG
ncbi:hypothetical protein [Amphritea sp. HPY]|uniref:hypothetical protein n=1 Tax=Amphritea sp. HPY TaxID=3421652 RepID=UPI003D7CD1E1